MKSPTRFSKLSVRQNLSGYLLILPAFLLIAVFNLYPILNGVYLSFTNYDGVSDPVWAGLQNYATMLQDHSFHTALWNTLIYVLGTVPLIILLSLFFAILLNQPIHGKKVFRSIYFLPAITSGVAIAIVWKWIFNTNSGLLNSWLYALGFTPVEWLTSSKYSMLSVIIMSVWKSLGNNIVIMLAGLQGVPSSLYEAASMDTNSSWKKFRHITIPLVSPTIFLICIMSIISAFQVFEQVMTLTEGGPGDSTLTVVYHIYNQAFENFKMGYASALAYILFLIILVVTIIQWNVKKHWVYSEME